MSFGNSSHVPLFQANKDGVLLFDLVELIFCVRQSQHSSRNKRILAKEHANSKKASPVSAKSGPKSKMFKFLSRFPVQASKIKKAVYATVSL